MHVCVCNCKMVPLEAIKKQIRVHRNRTVRDQIMRVKAQDAHVCACVPHYVNNMKGKENILATLHFG